MVRYYLVDRLAATPCPCGHICARKCERPLWLNVRHEPAPHATGRSGNQYPHREISLYSGMLLMASAPTGLRHVAALHRSIGTCLSYEWRKQDEGREAAHGDHA